MKLENNGLLGFWNGQGRLGARKGFTAEKNQLRGTASFYSPTAISRCSSRNLWTRGARVKTLDIFLSKRHPADTRFDRWHVSALAIAREGLVRHDVYSCVLRVALCCIRGNSRSFTLVQPVLEFFRPKRSFVCRLYLQVRRTTSYQGFEYVFQGIVLLWPRMLNCPIGSRIPNEERLYELSFANL